MPWLNCPLERLTVIILVSLLTMFVTLEADAAGAYPDDGLISERPNAGGPPEEISVRFALLDIDDIDDKEQRFSVDAYYEIAWQDHRLAIDPGASSEQRMRTYSLDDIWTPRLTIVNDRGLNVMLPRVADVDIDGNVIMRQRLSGRLAVDLNLQDFPFDAQQLTINIVSYQYPPAELAYSTNSELLADSSTFSADGWRFEILPPEFSLFRLDPDSPGRSRLTLAVEAQRNAGFYVLTLALPMTLILFMAWMVHWIQPEVVPARIGMSTATVFSLIALGVSFRLSLPQIDYLTRADRFVMYSTLLVLLSLGVTVLATRWLHQDRDSDALRLSLAARWALPLAFILIAVLVPNT